VQVYAPREQPDQLAVRGNLRSVSNCMTFTPDGKTAVAISESEVRVFDVFSGRLRTSWKHSGIGQLEVIALSANGSTVAAGRFTAVPRINRFTPSKILVWDTATGRQLAEVDHEVPFELSFTAHLALTPDGKTLIRSVIGQDGEKPSGVELLDVATGKRKNFLRSGAPVQQFLGLAVAPDGRTLASSEVSRSHGYAVLRLWDLVKGKELTSLIVGDRYPPPQPGLISIQGFSPLRHADRSLTFSPNGKMLATRMEGQEGDFVRLWDLVSEAGKVALKLRTVCLGPRGSAVCVAFSPDGKTLATGGAVAVGGGAVGVVNLYDPVSGDERVSLQESSPYAREVNGLAFSADGDALVSGNNLGDVILRGRFRGLTTTRIGARHGNVAGAALAPDGKTLATTDNLGRAHIWDLTKPGAGLHGPSSLGTGRIAGTFLSWSNDGKLLSQGEWSDVQRTRRFGLERLRLWNMPAGTPRSAWNLPPGVWQMRGRNLLRTQAGLVEVIDSSNGAVRFRRQGKLWHAVIDPSNHLAGATLTPDGQAVLVPETTTQVKLWNVGTGKELASFTLPEYTSFAPTFSPDGKTLFVFSNRHVRKGGAQLAASFQMVFDARTGRKLYSLEGRLSVFSADSKVLAVLQQQSIQVLDARTGKVRLPLAVPPDESLSLLLLSSDGTTLAGAAKSGEVYVWDTQTGELRGSIGGTSAVRTLLFGKDGRSLIVTREKGWGVELVSVPELPPLTTREGALLLARGRAAGSAGQWDQTAEHFLAALAKKPGSWQAAWQFYQDMDRLDRGLEFMDRAVAARPDDWDLRVERVFGYSGQNKADKAVADLVAFAQRQGDALVRLEAASEWLVGRARTREGGQRFGTDWSTSEKGKAGAAKGCRGAVALRKKMAELAPEDGPKTQRTRELYRELVRLLCDLRRGEEAAEFVRQRLALWPKDPEQQYEAARDFDRCATAARWNGKPTGEKVSKSIADEAMKTLRQALANGYKPPVATDLRGASTVFQALWHREDFKKLTRPLVIDHELRELRKAIASGKVLHAEQFDKDHNYSSLPGTPQGEAIRKQLEAYQPRYHVLWVLAPTAFWTEYSDVDRSTLDEKHNALMKPPRFTMSSSGYHLDSVLSYRNPLGGRYHWGHWVHDWTTHSQFVIDVERSVFEQKCKEAERTWSPNLRGLSKGYQLHWLQVSGEGKEQRWNAIWLFDTSKTPRDFADGLDRAALDKKIEQQSKSGYRLSLVCGYAGEKKTLFAANWVKDGLPSENHLNLTLKQLKEKLKAVPEDWHPSWWSSWKEGKERRYSLILVKGARKVTWKASYDLTKSSLQTEYNNSRSSKYIPLNKIVED
jgi:WD40 repeat protein